MSSSGKPILVDSHAHLEFPKLGEDLPGVLARAWEAGLCAIVAVGSGRGLDSARESADLASRESRVWSTAGLHPHDASQWSGSAGQELESLARIKRVVAVGETGLDFHYNHSTPDAQRIAFAEQIRLARRLKLPLVIHSREAEEETLSILSREKADEVGGVIHCFSGGPDMAEKALDLGFYISFSGTLTFPKAEGLRRIAASIPLDRILIETDAPYLAPVPLRGKRNEPAYVHHTAQKLADLRGLSLDEIARITAQNACRLFGITLSP